MASPAPDPRRPPRPSRLNQERWRRFKANRRGFVSLWVFTALFGLSLFAEVLANDKPLAVHVGGRWLFPVLRQYSETDLGGQLPTAADFRDPYMQRLLAGKRALVIWAPIRYSFGTINYDLPSPAPSPPTWQNLLGTDDTGRDVLAELIYGFRLAVLFGLSLTILSSAIGIAAGALQGYYGGLVDLLGQRFIEIWSGMPTLFILIILSSVVQPNFWLLLMITLIFGWMTLVGVVRAEFLRGRNFEYVLAAKAMGMSNARVMFRHMLPNAMIATVTFVPFILGGSITTLTSLDFLGFGLPPGSPSLGDLLAQGKDNLQAPWLGITSFVVLAATLTLLVFIGEAVRDALDPRRAA